MRIRIGTEHYDDTASLLCPSCGSEYLHQWKVTVFNRSEDADLTSVTMVVGGSQRHTCGHPKDAETPLAGDKAPRSSSIVKVA